MLTAKVGLLMENAQKIQHIWMLNAKKVAMWLKIQHRIKVMQIIMLTAKVGQLMEIAQKILHIWMLNAKKVAVWLKIQHKIKVML